MSIRKRSPLIVLGMVVFAAHAMALDGGAADTERRSAKVATVGKWTLTVGELEDRIASMPSFQLETFGATHDAIRRKYLNDVVIPEMLYAAYADEHHLADQPPYNEALLRTLANSTLRALRRSLGTPSSITTAEVTEYYAAHRAAYDVPERYGIWRILVATRDEAMQILSTVKKDPTPQTWTALARDHSLDKATYLRGGNLGFVTQDGASNEPGLRVEPAIVKAAMSVKDGEYAPDPVEEGALFAVVWRRGTIRAAPKTLEALTPSLRETLWRRRVEKQQELHIAALWVENVRDLNPDPLLLLEFPPPP